MKPISYINARSRTIPLAAAFSSPFSGFLNIDSLNILIGVNGAGKTTLLANIVECLHQQDESSVTGVRYSTTDMQEQEEIQWRTGPLSGCGVVFFTPLPYRRELVKAPSILDASPTYSRSGGKPRISVYRDVAATLGFKTELRGTISFSPKAVTRYLLPVLASDTFGPDSSPIKSKALALFRVQNEINDAQQSRELGNGADGIERLKEQHRVLEKDLIEALFERFQKHAPRHIGHPLLALASFEKLARSSLDRKQLTASFIELMGIGEVSHHHDLNYTRRFAALLQSTMSRTAGFLSGARASRAALSMTFPIPSDGSMPPSDIPVSLSWGHLPSGLLALVDQFARLKIAIAKQARSGCQHILVLIDEGDAYLHLDWQRMYIKMLDEFLGDVKRAYKIDVLQVILATHSAILVGDMPHRMVTNLSEQHANNVRTFAAPLDQLVFRSFESLSIGELAAGKIRELHSRIKQGVWSSVDEALINEIGDEAVRNALIRAREEFTARNGEGT